MSTETQPIPDAEQTPQEPAAQPAGAGAATVPTNEGSETRKAPKPPKKTLFEKVEAFVSKLSTRNKFWNRICSMIWLPYAYRSGITMSGDQNTYRATLPFRRFNKNWYNAMAGAALLGNSEIAGGNYVFSVCGGDCRCCTHACR